MPSLPSLLEERKLRAPVVGPLFVSFDSAAFAMCAHLFASGTVSASAGWITTVATSPKQINGLKLIF
jgi:hypothetical protein